jgi:hypothetical protein
MDRPALETASRGFSLPSRLLVLLLLVLALGYIGYLAIVLGPEAISLRPSDWLRGYERILEPAERRGAPLRTAQSGDRVYLLTTQAERIVPLWIGRRGGSRRIRDMLHVDVWALDATTARPAWKRRVRTFEDRGLLTFELLGADDGTLWLFVREPIGVALSDGAIVADGARIEGVNPALAGKRVDETGYVAFGGQGLQLTLNDATQWVVDGRTLAAQPRDTAPRAPAGILGPAHEAPYTSRFQMRGLPIGSRWLGVLSEEEATRLRADPVVPGATPGERPGVAADFFARLHVPDMLDVQPRAYRLWSARVTQVSAAPPGWPKELPDNWGTRDQYGDYQPLPEAPSFLQAGLLGDGRSERPFWFRDPDSVLVLHHDELGSGGRLRLARIAGPAGRIVWDGGLPLANLQAVASGERTLVFVGTEPNPAYDPGSKTSREAHEKIVAVDIASGAISTFDLTAESVRDEDFPPAP